MGVSRDQTAFLVTTLLAADASEGVGIWTDASESPCADDPLRCTLVPCGVITLKKAECGNGVRVIIGIDNLKRGCRLELKGISIRRRAYHQQSRIYHGSGVVLDVLGSLGLWRLTATLTAGA